MALDSVNKNSGDLVAVQNLNATNRELDTVQGQFSSHGSLPKGGHHGFDTHR